jgi:glutamate dehydrogenase
MPAKKELREQVITKVIDEIQQKLPGKSSKEIKAFVHYYYAFVAEDDLREQSITNLYGAVLSHWHFLQLRKPGEVKIRVFNPQYEQHGWQSKHTIIELVCNEMPFLVDSVRMALVEKGYTIHLLINPQVVDVVRNAEGQMTAISSTGNEGLAEAIIHIEIDQQCNPEALQHIESLLLNAVHDVELVVNDWQAMTHKAAGFIDVIKKANLTDTSAEDRQEVIDFLSWLVNDHFTFLGCCEYKLTTKHHEAILEPQPQTGLGLLRNGGDNEQSPWIKDIPLTIESKAIVNDLLVIRRLIESSTVHRPTAPYSIGIKIVDEHGKTTGKIRFVGLFTSTAYNSNIQTVPVLRLKVQHIIARSGLSLTEHAGKELLNILATYPRDELFQAKEDELYNNVIGIMHIQERPKVRLFVRKDIANRFFSCLVYAPREIFTSGLRQRMGEVLRVALNGTSVSFQTRVSESMLARIHFIILLPPGAPEVKYDQHELEKKLADAGRTWKDELKDALLEQLGEGQGAALYTKYRRTFPAGYRETFSARSAVFDIEHMEKLDEQNSLDISFYRSLEQPDDILNLKLYNAGNSLPLSDILPMLENMGLKVINENSYPIAANGDKPIWISDFIMRHQQGGSIDVESIRDVFQDAFAQVWSGKVENDGFNRLVLAAQLTWRETNILRAYAKFFRQIGVTFSQSYIEQALANHPKIAHQLVDLFFTYFNPDFKGVITSQATAQIALISEALEGVSSLDEDRILRRYLDVINATMRTNFFQKDEAGEHKSYLSLKIKSSLVPEMPLPHPLYEIFVYSPRIEGVHLRSAKVARGGLRWSDRFEDFRTEVLGLMKAQQVKNSIIVPAGAKGGFVCKRLPTDGNRDELMKEVVRCYSTFICGLLDITDNLQGEKVIPPIDVVRRDDDDTYLVVAADKGTATFSDIANGIAQQYNFWLGDAFASGGSEGYDHKKIGITARGAWVSVKRHFRELNVDIQEHDFTVVGIGDMSGDVFGNGMLLSRHIKLVAAFNHQHIFIDPVPDPETSFQERERLFNLPRSSWEDYDKNLISAGGGIFNRSVKTIKLTKEIKKLLKINKDVVFPNELIKAILTASVDLLWNGGIGTYVKASTERDADVGDRSNDSLRVNGRDLHCRVVGEGGNLGFTQLGRVEYSLNGGICFTDFVDNSGGVDCSDHEVNLKILLDGIVDAGDMTVKQRNKLLVDMTDAVAKQVLQNNYNQTQAISFAESRAKRTIDEHIRFINTMERWGKLNRPLEFLPNDDGLALRKANGQGLTRPELSILVAYSKMYLKEQLLNSKVPEDKYLEEKLQTMFLDDVGVQYAEYLKKHKLRRELIATRLANAICNEMGPTFITRLYDETGASAPEIARCFVVAREVFVLRETLDAIEELDHVVPANIQKQMMTDVVRLVRRATRWFLRNRRLDLDIAEAVAHFAPQVETLENAMASVVTGIEKNQLQKGHQHYVAAGVPEALAMRVASAGPMISSLDIVEAADIGQLPLLEVAKAYFMIGERLKLDWFRDEIDRHLVANTWDALARAACKDDLDRQQRTITMAVLSYPLCYAEGPHNSDACTEAWIDDHKVLIERWQMMVSDLRTTKVKEFTMFTVALRELLDLAQASIRKVAKK